MSSSFDPDFQSYSTEAKIVASLERISEAFRVLLWNESKAHGLSPLQVQVLIFLHYHSEEKCTVSYLAKEFNMAKPTISDTVKILERKELIQKVKSPIDTRS
ncbi:MAG: MarR family winged helix-turn-helix transcriptional regulator, partial [Flavobacteriales bacterium]